MNIIKLLLKTIIALLLISGSVAEDVKVDVLAKTTTSWNGLPLPSYGRGIPEITILRIVVAPGVELPWHQHPVINAGVLIKGKLTVITKSGQTLTLLPGDSIVEIVNQSHRGINIGDEPAEIIVFYAGVKDAPLTIPDSE